MIRTLLLTCVTVVAGILSGCAGAPAEQAATVPPLASSGTARAPGGPIAPDGIVKGMAATEVLARWGQPDEKRPFHTTAGEAEIWVYKRTVRSNQRSVATDTRMVTVFDSLTNGTKEIPEVVYSQETQSLIRITELLIFRDRLLEWNVSTEIKKQL